MKYVVMQRVGRVPYFLCAWRDGKDSWDCLRSRARAFAGPAARRIVDQLNARRPATAPLPVILIEVAR